MSAALAAAGRHRDVGLSVAAFHHSPIPSSTPHLGRGSVFNVCLRCIPSVSLVATHGSPRVTTHASRQCVPARASWPAPTRADDCLWWLRRRPLFLEVCTYIRIPFLVNSVLSGVVDVRKAQRAYPSLHFFPASRSSPKCPHFALPEVSDQAPAACCMVIREQT